MMIVLLSQTFYQTLLSQIVDFLTDRRNCYGISFRKSYFKSKRKIIAYYPLRKKGDHRSAAGCRWMRFVQQDGGGADRA